MTRILFVIGFIGMVIGVQAAENYREFTSADGKTIRGSILSFDTAKNLVVIERENGRRSNVPISVFSEEDQAYILEWNTVNEFLSSRSFSISVDKKRDNLPKEKKWREGTDDRGRYFKEFLKEVTSAAVYYEVEFYLMNAAPITDLRMEYIIYYEQSEESWGKQEPEQKNFKGQVLIPLVEPGNKCAVLTEKIEIHKDNVKPDSEDGKVLYGAKGDVHGMRARLYLKLPSGRKIRREFAYPEDLSRAKFSWKY